jgi:hypothetical protein
MAAGAAGVRFGHENSRSRTGKIPGKFASTLRNFPGWDNSANRLTQRLANPQAARVVRFDTTVVGFHSSKNSSRECAPAPGLRRELVDDRSERGEFGVAVVAQVGAHRTGMRHRNACLADGAEYFVVHPSPLSAARASDRAASMRPPRSQAATRFSRFARRQFRPWPSRSMSHASRCGAAR